MVEENLTQGRQGLKHRVLLKEAGRWVGFKEVGGNNMGQLVQHFQSRIGSAVGEPWCMSFVQSCCYWADQYVGGRKNILFPSELCMDVWDKTSSHQRMETPFAGCIVIWNYRGTRAGHTGIVTSYNRHQNFLMTIEGNTGDNERRVIREGDGVFHKKRTTRRSERSSLQLVGYLNPWEG